MMQRMQRSTRAAAASSLALQQRQLLGASHHHHQPSSSSSPSIVWQSRAAAACPYFLPTTTKDMAHSFHHRYANNATTTTTTATTTTSNELQLLVGRRRRHFSSSTSTNNDNDDSDLEGAGGPLLDFSHGSFPSPPPIHENVTATIPSPPPLPTPADTIPLDKDNYHIDDDDDNEDATDDVYSALHVEPMHVPQELMDRIERQEWQGGRMKVAQHGVLHEDPKVDMRLLMENYSVASLASALREREDVLQSCAILAKDGDFDQLQKVLRSFHPQYLLQRRKRKRRLDVCKDLDAGSLEVIRKALMRMPRTVTTAHTQRAGVVIPLCISNGVPSLLLEKRSPDLRAHPDEVCLPGGMVCSIHDTTIISTCLREMKEEIPGLDMRNVQTLGILRCNWGEVHHLVGVAVTPVVCYLGEVPDDLSRNSDEVAKVFTIPLSNLLKNDLWVRKQDLAPIFVGGPEIIWGLTGYILERFAKDIILPNHVRKDHHLQHHSLRNI